MISRGIDQLLPITVGVAQAKIEFPEFFAHQAEFPKGIAVVCHPHPLLGGTMDNKVAVTLSKTLNKLGFITIRFNFRGVGQSSGIHDAGIGETEDLKEILARVRSVDFWQGIPATASQAWVTHLPNMPYVLAGFSFGTYVSSRLVSGMKDDFPKRLILVGAACGKWDVPPVPANTMIIHGELDETVLLKDVFDWARPQELLVQVVPGADHFFHRKLHCIKQAILSAWHGVDHEHEYS